ncbi:MAG TPA: filamentous hemagglutinin N-terminal domain-containing protein [Thiotrichaceae bacterium]|nr:filamentous hemagglutinin N-terminal domain-containing protein [Thiotrichaceae bacterium]
MKTFTFLMLFIVHYSLQAEVITDGTLGQATSLSGPDYRISETLGQQRGSHLFHSFQSLNLNTGESATFTGPQTVTNILTRVTGGTRSWIDGTLRSEIPNANLYLLNPSGILFGKNAQLDITGSFHASTADYLRLGQDGRFDARQPNNSLLTLAPIEAFGFLDQPAPITLQDSFLSVPNGKSLSLIGGDLQMTDSTLYAPSGQINLAAVASKGEVLPTSSYLVMNSVEKQGTITLSLSAMDRLQQIEIENVPPPLTNPVLGNLDVSGMGGGQIFIRAGQFVLDKSWVFADNYGDKPGVGVDIRVDGDMRLTNGARITADNLGNAQGGNVTIKTSNLLFSGRNTEVPHPIQSLSTIATNNFLGIGNGGDIKISTSVLEINPGLIQAATAGIGNAGNIHLELDSLKLNDNAFINSSTFATGQAGNITINATNDISVSNMSSLSAGTAIHSQGNAGDIALKTPLLRLENGGVILGYSEGSGNAGSINVITDTASFNHRSGITTESTQAGGGNIHLSVRDRLSLADNSRITAEAQGIEPQHSGGNLTISSPQLSLNNSLLLANAKRGHGGLIDIRADQIQVLGDSRIDVSSELGLNGSVFINDTELTITPHLILDYLDATAILPTRCAERSGANLSRFVLTGPNLLPEAPHDLSVHLPTQLLTKPSSCPGAIKKQ